MIGSLYIIINDVNGKMYVGKTYSTLSYRFNEHIQTSKRDYAGSRPLYKAFKKYGIDNFNIHEIGKYEEGVLELEEIKAIKRIGTFENGYNLTLGGDGAPYLGLDTQAVVLKYKQLKKVYKVANYFNCCIEAIRKILLSENIEIKKTWELNKVKVLLVELNLEFDGMIDAAKYLIKENLSTSSNEGHVAKMIGHSAKGRREKAYNFHWKFI